jgi:hypothetical protein
MTDTLVQQSTIEPTNINENYLSGYHRCCLEQPYHLDYASQDLCNKLGYTSLEIHTLFHDKYSKMVYSKDRRRYLHFVEKLASTEQTLSLQYHMVCKDGHMIYVNDTMTSRRLEDGRMYGFAVVADIPEGQQLQEVPTSVIPQQLLDSYGFVQCTCEKYPKITHTNDQMLHYLGVTEENSSWHDFLKENIFFMIPFEERDMFREFLDSTTESAEPTMIEHHIMRYDGTSIPVTGWLSVIKNEFGEQEYAFIYTWKESSAESKAQAANNSYFNALEKAYNVIFELNLAKDTVECIHGRETSAIGTLYDINMTIESARTFWLSHYIVEEDRPMMKDFLNRISTVPLGWHNSSAIQAEFRIHWTDNVIYKFLGVAIQLDTSTVLLCCRDISSVKYSSLITHERAALNKLDAWLTYLITRDTTSLGIILLAKADQKFSLVYASEEIRSYMDLGEQNYLRYISGELPIEDFLRIATFSSEILDTLEREHFVHTETSRKDSGEPIALNISCQVHNYSGQMLYEITFHLGNDEDEIPEGSTEFCPVTPPVEKSSGIVQFSSRASKKVFARTFGHFDLFVDKTPVNFSSSKEKELMALLIDRNGGTLTANEAISYLWEDEAITERVSSRYRKLAMNLKNTLTRYGIEHILINSHGTRSIDTSAIKCDYYELISGNQKYRENFHNSYMTDYSWAEETLATLWDYS